MNHLELILIISLVAAPAFADEAVTPNRTLPKFRPPKTTLEFSANPTVEEISHAHVFEEPLVPIGGKPSGEENAALATALRAYKRSSPDDFSSMTAFLEQFPTSSWRPALLMDLGLDYFHSARYSKALVVWQEAWALSQSSGDAAGKLLADRAACELAGLYSRLGRITELEALLNSVEKRVLIGAASERINVAREALANMKYRPEISFRCGPLALRSILAGDQRLLASCPTNALTDIFNSASTQRGISLSQVAALSKKVGLNYQMAFRSSSRSSRREEAHSNSAQKNQKLLTSPATKEDFIVPSVVHWKAGHYAAIVQKDGDRYLVEDPTFNTSVWATKSALEEEASGYFLIPPADLPIGWRAVDAKEGDSVRGKGTTGALDANQYTCSNEQTKSCATCGAGMPVVSAHLMLCNYQIRDTPVGYTPPVGPPIRFTVRYNHRDIIQPAGGVSKIFGPKWTHDWNEYLAPAGANINYVVGGGGVRIFSGFDTNTQTFAPQQYEQTLLRRTGPSTFEMVWPDGSMKLFGPLNNGSGFLLAAVRDPAGNAVTLNYDGSLRLVALTDAIGQVTTLSYENTNNSALITKVTDPFGRFATFQYATLALPLAGTINSACPSPSTNQPNFFEIEFLFKVTDVLGLQSQFNYKVVGSSCKITTNGLENIPLFNDTIQSLDTPYGNTSFFTQDGIKTVTNESTIFRDLVISYPDGSSERVLSQKTRDTGIAGSEPDA